MGSPRSLRIGFDVSPLVRPHPDGVVRATEGLVGALEQRAAAGAHGGAPDRPSKLEIVRLAPGPGEALRAWRQRELPRLARELELFGIHSPVSAFAWRGPGKRLQTVHELPWRHGARENADLRHRLWASLGSRRADLVIAPSAHVARDLGGRSRVVPWGRDPRYASEPAPGEVDELLLGRYRLGEDPLVLCLGAVRAKKNLAAVLEGLAALRARRGPRLRLLVTGAETADLRRDLGRASRLGLAGLVSTPGRIPGEHLPGLVRLASAVAVLSISEGFAFPVLDALACGVPVLVPPGSAQAELAGGAGIAADPRDPASVADGLLRALDERHSGRAARLERAAAFTWERAAEAVSDLWSSLA